MATIHPASTLGQGLRALAAGQIEVAEPLLREALRQSPRAAEALSALGQIAAQRQQWADAERLFQRSLDSNPAQPRVWLARAQMLEMLARAVDATEAFAQAAARQPDWPLARYHLARLLREGGRTAAALAEAEQAAKLAPQDVNTLQLLALLREDSADLPGALGTLEAAILRAPERAALHHNRGVVLHRLGRHAEALAAHEQALSLGLNLADAHYNHGNTLQSLGRADAALAAYRRALSLAPLHALSLYDLAKLRWALGHADFDAELQAAERANPASEVPPGLRALLLLRAERGEAAEQAFRRAAALAPHTAAYADGLGQALCLQGRHAEAAPAHARAVALAPQDVAVLGNAARSGYAGGRVADGLALAARAVALAPHDQHAIALQSLGWRLTADPRDAWLHDLDQVLGVIDLPPPPGWADMAGFNAALAEALTRLHTDAQAPIDQTLRQGTQTRGNLFDLGLPLVTALRTQIEAAITTWLATRPADPAHPLFGRNTGRWRFTDSWSSRLRSTGFHTNHVHGHGWLSSCYYVAAPPAALQPGVKADRPAGWIQFGEPDLPEPARSRLPPLRFEAPKPGRLLLFPSWLWHGTMPFVDEAHRLTIAFDVLPA